MIVVALVASIAYPSYTRHITKTRNAEAQIKLLEVMLQQRVFFTSNSRYSDDLIGDLKNTKAAGEEGVIESENGYYLISAGRCEPEVLLSDCVLLTAAPNFISVNAPTFTYNSKNQKNPPEYW